MKIYNIFLLCLLGGLVSCGYSDYFLKSEGDIAIITTKKDPSVNGELISIQDSIVYILQDNTERLKKTDPEKLIASINIGNIDSICIQGYSDRNWGKWIFYFEAIPGALMTIAVASYGKDANVGAAFMIFEIPALFTYLLFEATNLSAPSVSAPNLISNINKIKKFARFPLGINEFQMNKLLQKYRQKEIKRIY
jgi:hypothetical protein